MKKIRGSFATLLAAVAAIGWSVAFGFDNEKLDVSVDHHNAISSPGANLLGLDTAIADTGMPPPLIVISFASDRMGSDIFTDVGQNGLHRTVAAAPPLIFTALSHDKAMQLNDSAISGIDIAGGIMAYDTQQQLTAYDWSSGKKNAGATTFAASIANPFGSQALDSA